MSETTIEATCILIREIDNSWTSICPEFGIASCGVSSEHAAMMLDESIRMSCDIEISLFDD